jgi:hypothetical protein
MKPILSVSARLFDKKQRRFVVEVHMPQLARDGRNYVCTVKGRGALPFAIDVYGVHVEQAVRLALEMVTIRVGHAIISSLLQNPNAFASHMPRGASKKIK